MFKKLRNKLILINLSITTMVIITAFSTIYLIFANSANHRPPAFQKITITTGEGTEQIEQINNEDLSDYIASSMREERNVAARELLISLVISGVLIECVVIFVSYIMAEEAIKPVREAYQSQKIFIANASHEIKTPLAAISANLEAADIKDNRWIKNVELETEKLTALNSELLTLARTDLVENTKPTSVNLALHINESLNSFESRLGDKKLTRKLDLPHEININSADYLQILSILMDNAIKYSKSSIKVTATKHSLEITNDGKAISKQDLGHIFERFYQVDKSAEGVGLGLAIAKSLADRNRWHLSASSTKGRTTFTLRIS